MIRNCARVLEVATIAGCLVLAVQVKSLSAQESKPAKAATDTSMSEEKAEKGKGPSFIPIPIFITEPAIGYGLGAALGYFHPRKGEPDVVAESISPAFTSGTPPTQGTDKGKKRPPTISGVAVAYTENGTWGAGVGHSASWREDRMRYKGALAYANVNSTFYYLDTPVDFNLKGGLLYQDLKLRIGSSDFWLGGRFSYMNADSGLEQESDAGVDFGGDGIADSGLAFAAIWDSRDNTMTPNHGQLIELVAWRYDEAIGGDFNYWKSEFKALSFHQFSEKFVLGLRLDCNAVDGEPPFWSYPWITLRGVPALRYQNDFAGAFETELRWNLFTKWAVLAFAGVGATRGDTLIYEDESGIVAGGIGGRYLFRPEDDLWVGVDVAVGPEDAYAYIQVGHAW